MHMDVLDSDFLLTLAAVAVERLQQHGVGARQLVRLAQVLASSVDGLFADHRPPVTFHRGVVRRNELRRHHALEFVLRRDTDQSRDRGLVLLMAIVLAALRPTLSRGTTAMPAALQV